MKPKLYSSIAAVFVVATIGAGCGGDDETTTSTTSSSITTGTSGASGASGTADSTVLAAANEICESTDKAVDEAIAAIPGGAPSGPPTGKQAEQVADALTPVVEDALDQISAVPGAEDDPGITEFLDAIQSDLDAVNSDPEAAFSGDDPFTATNDAATEAGLDECAN
ncbi:MAG: hypothetical protein ACR2OC_00810 [Solirubrobacterales bacterium]